MDCSDGRQRQWSDRAGLSIAKIMANTNMAAAAGVVIALIASSLRNRRPDLTLVLNGAIGGLVAITAQPLAPALWQAAIVGSIGGLLIVFVTPLFQRMRVDGVVGAIPAHLVCGIWGIIAVAFTARSGENGLLDQLLVQLTGIGVIGGLVVVTSMAAWFVIDRLIGVKASEEDQRLGLDHAELRAMAYPYFSRPEDPESA